MAQYDRVHEQKSVPKLANQTSKCTLRLNKSVTPQTVSFRTLRPRIRVLCCEVSIEAHSWEIKP